MTTHELAQKLLALPDVEVRSEYDGEYQEIKDEDIRLKTKKGLPQDPEPPFVVIY